MNVHWQVAVTGKGYQQQLANKQEANCDQEVGPHLDFPTAESPSRMILTPLPAVSCIGRQQQPCNANLASSTFNQYLAVLQEAV
jgi:hypothetical protein